MIKVSIVEDDPMVQEINKRFLERIEGFSYLMSYRTIKEAKEDLAIRTPDLILLDVFLPDGKGIELLKWIRLNDIDSDVILITADNSTETFNDASRFGVVDYLVKPFNYERFESSLYNYSESKKYINSNTVLNQGLIDRINHINDQSDVQEMDYDGVIKNQTYRKILYFLKKNKEQSFTAVQIAELLGISRITARRYLDHLEKHNILLLELEYGTVGRPKNKYKINEAI